MRLIDADKLDIYDISPAMGFSVMGVTEEDIALAELIDAIPTDWIVAQIQDASGAEASYYSRLLKKWRKENERPD